MFHPRIVATGFVVSALGFGCAEDSCFIGDTDVATPSGMRRIAELAVGDEVYSYDHEHAELVVRTVRRIFVSQVTTVCRVETNGRSIRGVTPSHPFFDAHANAYVALRDLAPTARLLRLNALGAAPLHSTRVEKVAIDERAQPCFTVYNLEVEGPEHNYFADGVLVHNKSDSRPRDCEHAHFSTDYRLDGMSLTLDTTVIGSGPWLDGPNVTDLVRVSFEGIEDTTPEDSESSASANIFLRVDESELESGSIKYTLDATVDGLDEDPGPCMIAVRKHIYFIDGRIKGTAGTLPDD